MFSVSGYDLRTEAVLEHRVGPNQIEPVEEDRMAAQSLCKIDGCGKRTVGRGWCDAHYRRWKRHGDPEGGRVAHGEPMRWLKAHVGHTGSSCLRWPYGASDEGYGKIAQDGKWRNASRVMCEIVHGPAPTPSHQACHSCGKGHEACVSPAHLYWGTPTQNNADQLIHGTRARGERQGQSRLTEAVVLEIRRQAEAVPQVEIARRFGITKQLVNKIVRRERWAWLREALG